jgi:negative regulator of flagellin synthesis FlgM
MKMPQKSSIPKMEAYLLSKKPKKIAHLKTRACSCSNNDRHYEIAMIKKILEQTPDIREEKVAALRKAVKRGSYVIHSRKIAEQMIKESLLDLDIQHKDKR